MLTYETCHQNKKTNFVIILMSLFFHYGLLVIAAKRNMSQLPPSYLHLTNTAFDRVLQWDSQWYVDIGHYGYVLPDLIQRTFIIGHMYPFSIARSSAFFPLLPTIVHLFGTLGALFLTNVLFICSVFLLATWLERHRLSVVYGIILYALNPAGVYESSLYTESFLVVASLLIILFSERRSRYWWVTLFAGFISSVTAGLGILTGILSLNFFVRREWIKGMLFGVSTLCGWVTYGTVLHRYHANPLLFLQSEREEWRRVFDFPLRPFFRVWNYGMDSFMIWIEEVIIIVYVILLILFVIRQVQGWRLGRLSDMRRINGVQIPIGTAIWTVVYTLITFSTEVPSWPIQSEIRYMSAIWPLYGFNNKKRILSNIFRLGTLTLFVSTYFWGSFLLTHGVFYQ